MVVLVYKMLCMWLCWKPIRITRCCMQQSIEPRNWAVCQKFSECEELIPLDENDLSQRALCMLQVLHFYCQESSVAGASYNGSLKARPLHEIHSHIKSVKTTAESVTSLQWNDCFEFIAPLDMKWMFARFNFTKTWMSNECL